MRASTVVSGIAAAILSVGPAAAKELGAFSVDKAAPLSKDGRAVLDAEAGPVDFGEVLLQDVPTEADPRSNPTPVVVVSNHGMATAKLDFTVTLEDGQGNVYAKGARSVRLDEETSNETFRVSMHLEPGDWPKVTAVHLVARALAAVGAVAVKETGPFTADKVVPLSKDGRAVLDAQAGPVTFGEVLLQDMPTETDPRRDPTPVVVISNYGSTTAKIDITVTLEDDQGNFYVMGTRSTNLNEDAWNEAVGAFTSEHIKPYARHRQLSPGDWPKVTVVHLVARVVMD